LRRVQFMTMVLGLVIRAHAFHVSDRLVTQRTAEAVSEFDPLANKTVIFRARDGVMTIGYSGRAYLDGVPTDVWIARSLTEGNFAPQFGIGSASVSRHNWRHVGPALERLRVDAQAAIAQLSEHERRSYLQKFQIVGLRWTRRIRRFRPIACTIEEQSFDSPELVITHYGRHLPPVRTSRAIWKGQNGTVQRIGKRGGRLQVCAEPASEGRRVTTV
jgi:hypothetical protein